MIKKLQRKFIIITMASLLGVLLFLVGAINILNIYQMNSKINESLAYLAENEGKFPRFDKDFMPKKGDPLFRFEPNEETPFQTRYFVVHMDEDRMVGNIDTGHIAAVSSQDARELAEKVMEHSASSGFEDIYKYRIVENNDGYMIIFIDCRDKLQTTEEIFAISCTVAFSVLVLMFLLVSILSKKAMKPFIENAEKQKLFITDAGHEIKTPLAIISANADVLEITTGQNEWITSIRNQTTRLDQLVKNLLVLSKMEEEQIKLSFQDFDLSAIVMRIAEPFSALAQARNKKLSIYIQPDVYLNGDVGSIEQLVSTLMDNAIKYSDDGGSIKISLTTGKKGKKLEVYNTTGELAVQNLDKLFDRFYRLDSSRSRENGGYGIGLSIAKSIVEAHNGKISVKSEDQHSICFTVRLP